MRAATLDPRTILPRSRASGRSDEQLARAAARGDVAAFEALYERYHLALLSFSRHMVGRAHDAEDVVQHTFLAADRAFRSGKVPKAVRAWLYTVARNRCVSVLRARREDAGLPDAGLPSTENLVADVETREDLRELLGDLRGLPDDQRAALLLSELGDLTHPEVAAVIGVRPAKVKALVYQARETLMASAHARAISCGSIREELAVATGAGLRKRHLRNHLAQCDGCRDYATAVRSQRTALAALLPVIPTIALRDSVFAGLGAGAGGAAAGAGAGAGAGAAGMLAAKSTAVKVLATIAIGGAAAGGGGVAVRALDGPDSRQPAGRTAEPAGGGGAPAPAGDPAGQPSGTPVPALGGDPGTADRTAGPADARNERRSDDAAGRHDAAAKREAADEADARGDANGRDGDADTGNAEGEGKGKGTKGEKTPPGQARKEQRGAPPGQQKVKVKPKPQEPKAPQGALRRSEKAPAPAPRERGQVGAPGAEAIRPGPAPKAQPPKAQPVAPPPAPVQPQPPAAAETPLPAPPGYTRKDAANSPPALPER